MIFFRELVGLILIVDEVGELISGDLEFATRNIFEASN
jgi:hypothetical protein